MEQICPWSKQNSCFCSCLNFLQLSVNMLLVRGSVDSALVDSCSFHHILVLQHVPYEVLQNVGAAHETSLLTYIGDALQVQDF